MKHYYNFMVVFTFLFVFLAFIIPITPVVGQEVSVQSNEAAFIHQLPDKLVEGKLHTIYMHNIFTADSVQFIAMSVEPLDQYNPMINYELSYNVRYSHSTGYIIFFKPHIMSNIKSNNHIAFNTGVRFIIKVIINGQEKIWKKDVIIY